MSAPRPPFVEEVLAGLAPDQRAHAERIADAYFAKHGALYAATADSGAIRRIWEAARDEARAPSEAEPDPSGQSREAWQEPIPLTDVRGLPDFPTTLLPAWLRDFVDDVATEIQTPRCVPAMIALSVVAAAVARKVALHVRDNWTEALNLYTVTALGPANLKTPAFKMACAPLETFERVKAAEARPAVVQAENKKANLKAQLEATRKQAARAKTEVERHDAERDTDELARQLAEFRLPRSPQLIANDVTEESIGKLLMENDGRIAIMSDEGGPFRNMAGRYQNNGAPIFEAFKHAHNAGTVRVNRAGRELVHVPVAAITLALMVQPALLRSLRQTSEFRAEGLLARFLYAVPESMVGARNLRAKGVPIDVAAAYRDQVKALLSMPFGSDLDGATAPHVMELTPEARERLIVLREGLEPRLGRGGDLSHVGDWAGKLAGATARIAALLHLSQLADRPEPWRTPVTVEAMDAAIAISRDFLIPHALVAFSLIGGSPASDLAEVILPWIRRHGAARFTKRDLHRHMRRQVTDPKEWDAALALLVEHSWIREIAGEPNPKGGRPFREYEVNPAALTERGAR